MQSDQLKSYLQRIGMEVPETPSLDMLKQIQEKHIYAIPVENLDVVKGKLPLSLEIDDLADKVVNRRRGGLSFELNLLLADALRDLGYSVKLMSAKHPKYGHEFDHAFLLVEVPGDRGAWVVDVGYTENFRTPLLFDERIWQSDGRDDYTFRAVEADGERGASDAATWQLLRRRGDDVEVVYSFKLEEHEPREYVDQCSWFCTNERSRFTQGPLAYIERPEGRICLSVDTVSNTFTGEQIRPIVRNAEEERSVLREIFGIELDDDDSPAADGKFGYGRVFAAIAEDDLFDKVVEEAVRIGIERKSHVRFGHIVSEAERTSGRGEFPAYVQSVRERVTARVAAKLEDLGVTGELLGGEVVVMGSNTRIGATIDSAADYAPEQLVEALVKPFNPDLLVCGSTGKTRLQSFFRGSVSDYLTRKLDCEVVVVKR